MSKRLHEPFERCERRPGTGREDVVVAIRKRQRVPVGDQDDEKRDE